MFLVCGTEVEVEDRFSPKNNFLNDSMSLSSTRSSVSPLLYSTGSSPIGLFIKQRGLLQQWIRPSTLLWHPMDITSFHIAARCVCIDKTSFVVKKRWAGDQPLSERLMCLVESLFSRKAKINLLKLCPWLLLNKNMHSR